MTNIDASSGGIRTNEIRQDTEEEIPVRFRLLLAIGTSLLSAFG